MSTPTRYSVDAEALRARAASLRRRLIVVLFGDYVGLTVFCATLFVLGVTWREGVFINDNYAVANALVAVEEGHLDLRRAAYGPSLGTPGVFEGADGRPYGRNYAQVFLALPVLVLLRGVAVVADLRLLLTGGWVLLLLLTLRWVGHAVGRRRAATIGGSVLALVLFVASLPFATQLPSSWLPFLALQFVTAIATALIGVLGYRLLAQAYSRRVGVAAAVGMVFGTSTAFWGTIPKRHILSACLALLAVYCLYRSRTQEANSQAILGDDLSGVPMTRRVGYRAAAYASVGIVAWVGVPEAVALGPAVFVADLATSVRHDWLPRAVLVVGLVSVVAFLPFAATNTAIAGNPFEPPLGLSGYDPPEEPTSDGAATPTPTPSETGLPATPTATPTAIPTAEPTPTPPPTPPGTATPTGGGIPDISFDLPLSSVTNRMMGGMRLLTQEPERVYRTFIRSQYTTRGSGRADTIAGANLAVLEAAPVLGGLLGFVVLGLRRIGVEKPLGSVRGLSSLFSDPLRTVDIFAVCYSILLSLVYISSLPLHAMINTRYLMPMYPLLAYLVVRIPAVREAIGNRWQWAAWTYMGTVLIGGQMFFAAVTLGNSSVGESMQAHSVVNLGIAGLLATWVVAATLATRRDAADRYDGIGAILLGLAAGAGTVLVLLASIAYFPVGDFLLPLVPDL